MKATRLLMLIGGQQKYWQKVKLLFGTALVAGWNFDDTSGTTAADFSGNGFNGTYSNFNLAQPGLVGNAVKASANTNKVDCVTSREIYKNPANNYVNNPGFETAGAGGADVFNVWDERAADGAIEQSSGAGEFHGGAKALKLTCGATTSGSRVRCQEFFSLFVSTDYVLSFWTRGDGTNPGYYQVNGGALISTEVTGTTWTLVTVPFTTNSSTTDFWIGFYSPAVNGGIAYFDDVTLKAASGKGINYNEGSIAVLFQPAAATWTNGLMHYLWLINPLSKLRKDTASNSLTFENQNSGFIQATKHFYNPTRWVMATCTWSVSNNRMRLYIDGVQQGADITGVLEYTGTPSSFTLAGTGTAGQSWPDYLDAAFVLNREMTAAEALTVARMPSAVKVFSILGDSISLTGATDSWPQVVCSAYPARNMYINHSVGGQGIINNLDGQVVAAANDNADFIILTLGTNDDNAGNMTTLQAKVESGITTLRASNPGATIYYFNLLPRWTDTGGATPVDKAATRTAIAAACAAQGVACWDSFTVPWIAAGDTSDGLHPTAGGHAKIAVKVLALLP